jgi:dihydrofolate reductase
MAKLIYVTPTSLNGYIADETGDFDWAAPDEEVHAFINDIVRPIGTYLYGRKMYQTMAVWETPDVIPGRTPAILDFATIWQAADKIVYSKSLETVSTRKTRLEREFDPQVVRHLKAQLPHDVAVGGPTLAAHAIRAGIVDEYHLFVAPIIMGGDKPVLPGNVRVTLELLDERGFDNGMVYLRYRAGTSRSTP